MITQEVDWKDSHWENIWSMCQVNLLLMSVVRNSEVQGISEDRHNSPKPIYEVVDINNGVSADMPPESRRADVHRTPPSRINLSHTIRRLRMCGWYWGDITSDQAKGVLSNAKNGSFIVRDSTDACHLFTLSLKANNIVVSVRVAFSRGLFKLDSWNQEDSPSFSSVVDMVDYYLADESHEFYVELPRVGEFAVCLKHPIWKEVPGLQHLCRTTIVKYCRTSKQLRLLPLPPHLIRYVLDFSPEDPSENGSEQSTKDETENKGLVPDLSRNLMV